jgi:pimeloyl-ACP methyl ester carboxylesterase
MGDGAWTSLESAAIKMSAHHPFRSEKAKERYLKLYDMRAKEWPVASETRMAPTLYLVGENEKLYSAQKAVQRLHKAAPQIEAEIIPKAGHDLTFVQAELVNRKVVEFLERSYRLTTPSVTGGV